MSNVLSAACGKNATCDAQHYNNETNIITESGSYNAQIQATPRFHVAMVMQLHCSSIVVIRVAANAKVAAAMAVVTAAAAASIQHYRSIKTYFIAFLFYTTELDISSYRIAPVR